MQKIVKNKEKHWNEVVSKLLTGTVIDEAGTVIDEAEHHVL